MKVLSSAAAFLFLGTQVFAGQFPEEAVRSKWDRGCDDWPNAIPSPQNRVSPDDPVIQVSRGNGQLRALAQVEFRPQLGQSVSQLSRALDSALSSPDTYPKWVMPGINTKPGGGNYFVRLESLRAQNKVPAEELVFHGDYQFQILFFKRSGEAELNLRRSVREAPRCESFEGNTHATRYLFRMVPQTALFSMLVGEMWLIEKKDSVEVRMRVVNEPRRIVYNLLPDSLLKKDLGQRTKVALSNLQELLQHEKKLAQNSGRTARAVE
jgi:hypothetical protein